MENWLPKYVHCENLYDIFEMQAEIWYFTVSNINMTLCHISMYFWKLYPTLFNQNTISSYSAFFFDTTIGLWFTAIWNMHFWLFQGVLQGPWG